MKKEPIQQPSLAEDTAAPLRYEDVPALWAVCPNGDCPRAHECLRHHAYTLAPKTEKQHLSVLPQAWQEGPCTEFAEDRPQRLAWGMTRLFRGIPEWKATAIRHELYDLFGAERTYYRYRRGEYVITPEVQQQIADLFARHGITAPRQYDIARLTYYFPSPGFGSLHSYTDERTLKRLEEWKRSSRG
ncbi:MAG: hypothetical protein IJ064_00445 [Bacteroidaceae bacterium]|nr:hypothetical protein [Bacteroidaceae bacterium]